jgi:hypothetical protein
MFSLSENQLIGSPERRASFQTMLVVLYQRGCQGIARSIASDLRDAFANHIKVALIAASSSSPWPADIFWDDLLLVIYSDKNFPATGNAFITQYLKARSPSAILLPVALDPAATTPPAAAAAIKALEYDHAAKGPKGRLVNRVGGMLGLRVQGRDSKIFISYRAKDGAAIAEQLYAHLISLGHRPFLDKAEELDGETKIIPGSPVQKQIDDALDKSNLVLLIDTPSAPDSRWIMHEVETADSFLLPILPICFRAMDDSKRGPRFRSLVALQRWVPLPLPDPADDPPLEAGQLDEIVREAEQYMCEIFRRKCRVPFIVEKEFVSRGFAWKELDQRLLMYESSKSSNWRVPTKVLSHCSIFDPNYGPAMKKCGAFLKATARCNHSLFIYDGELLPKLQLEEIVKAQEDPVIILHHQELAALIGSSFTDLVAA